MDEIHSHFANEHTRACIELKRLQLLWENARWYNFECQARKWRTPWLESVGESEMILRGARYTTVNNRARRKQKSEDPIWYKGPCDDAPPLPPQILYNELKAAQELVEFHLTNCTAPYDWAPGGDKYEQMLRESPTVKMFGTNSSDT